MSMTNWSDRTQLPSALATGRSLSPVPTDRSSLNRSYNPHEGFLVEGNHKAMDEVTCPTTCIMGGMVRSTSMDLVNDPRFYAKNVMDKRMSAVKTLSVVASLMTGLSVKMIVMLDKQIDFSSVRGWMQMFGFCVQCAILFFNLTASMVLIFQLLFVFRLLTSGPTGFENAASFYLHKDVIFWRHFSVKVLGLSLSLFLVSAGFMLFVMFDEAVYPEPKFEDKKLIPEAHTAVGFVVLVVFFLEAILLFFVRSRHIQVFQRQYQRGSIAPLNLNSLQDPTFMGMLDT